MDPDAPGLFSTMNCCPIDSFSFTASRRASGSTVPRGGKGTTNLTGLVGQFTLWAVAGSDASAAQNASPATARRPNNVLIMLSPLKNLLSYADGRKAFRPVQVWQRVERAQHLSRRRWATVEPHFQGRGHVFCPPAFGLTPMLLRLGRGPAASCRSERTHYPLQFFAHLVANRADIGVAGHLAHHSRVEKLHLHRARCILAYNNVARQEQAYARLSGEGAPGKRGVAS